MCFGGKSPAPQPAAPPPVQAQDDTILQSRDADRRRRAKAAGTASTILTGPTGQQAPAGGGKTLLGA